MSCGRPSGFCIVAQAATSPRVLLLGLSALKEQSDSARVALTKRQAFMGSEAQDAVHVWGLGSSVRV